MNIINYEQIDKQFTELFQLPLLSSESNIENRSLSTSPVPKKTYKRIFTETKKSELFTLQCIDGEVILDKTLCKNLNGVIYQQYKKSNDKYFYIRKSKSMIMKFITLYTQTYIIQPCFISKTSSKHEVTDYLQFYCELQLSNPVFCKEFIEWFKLNENYQIPIEYESHLLSYYLKLTDTSSSSSEILSFFYPRIQTIELKRQCFEAFLNKNGVQNCLQFVTEKLPSFIAFVISKIKEGVTIYFSVLLQIISKELTFEETQSLLICCLYLVKDETKRKEFISKINLQLIYNKMMVYKENNEELVSLYLQILYFCSQEIETQNILWNQNCIQSAVQLMESNQNQSSYFNQLNPINYIFKRYNKTFLFDNQKQSQQSSESYSNNTNSSNSTNTLNNSKDEEIDENEKKRQEQIEQNIYLCITTIASFCGFEENNKRIIKERIHHFLINNIRRDNKYLRDEISEITTSCLYKIIATLELHRDERVSLFKRLIEFFTESKHIPSVLNILNIISLLLRKEDMIDVSAKHWFSIRRLLKLYRSETQVILNVIKLYQYRIKCVSILLEEDEMDDLNGCCLEHISDKDFIVDIIKMNKEICSQSEWCKMTCKHGIQSIIAETFKYHKEDEEIMIDTIDMVSKILSIEIELTELKSYQFPEMICEVMNRFDSNELLLENCGIILKRFTEIELSTDEIKMYMNACYSSALKFTNNKTIQSSSLSFIHHYLLKSNDFETFESNGTNNLIEQCRISFEKDITIQHDILQIILYLLKNKRYIPQYDIMMYFTQCIKEFSTQKEIVTIIVESLLEMLSPQFIEWVVVLNFLVKQSLLSEIEKCVNKFQSNFYLYMRYSMLVVYKNQIQFQLERNEITNHHFTMNEFIYSVVNNEYINNALNECQTMKEVIQKVLKFNVDENSNESIIAAMSFLSQTKEFEEDAITYISLAFKQATMQLNPEVNKYFILLMLIIPDKIFQSKRIEETLQTICNFLLSYFDSYIHEEEITYLTFRIIIKCVRKISYCKRFVKAFNTHNTIENIIEMYKTKKRLDICELGTELLSLV